MMGSRANTTSSRDVLFDSFATIGAADGTVRILAGSRAVTGIYTLEIQGFEAVGYSASETLDAECYACHGPDDIFDVHGVAP